MARRVRTYLDGDAQTDEMLRPSRSFGSDVLPERK